ncbi:MAG TPA: carboxymuconolactone decarboxylase family protein [Nocardioidaceae bacterium]|nr:carboxymuconolactone decarboxylase family protein [Nocardioidaceae bacterium]
MSPGAAGRQRRLEPIPPETLDGEQRELYGAITGGPRARGPQTFALTRDDGTLRGPFNAMLLSPALGGALQELGATIRYRSTLPARTREIAILTVAAHWDSAFERSAHEAVGASVGLSEDELAAIRAGRVPVLGDAHENACAHLVRAMVDGDVDDATWDRHAETAGNRTVLELTTVVGYYATLALQLRVFRVE